MRDVVILFLYLIVTVVRLARPGGLRSVVAESLLVKQQLRITRASFLLAVLVASAPPHRLWRSGAYPRENDSVRQRTQTAQNQGNIEQTWVRPTMCATCKCSQRRPHIHAGACRSGNHAASCWGRLELATSPRLIVNLSQTSEHAFVQAKDTYETGRISAIEP